MSSICSMPMERRISELSMPAAASCCGESCEWVVEAGWMARDLASPTLARWENSSSPSMNRLPAAIQPRMPKVTMPPQPLVR